MQITKRAGTALKKSLIAFVALSYSATTTRAVAEENKGLFGLNLQLDRVKVWKNEKGEEYLGWPKEDADKIRYVLEEKIPLLLDIKNGCEQLKGLYAEGAAIKDKSIATSNEIAKSYGTLADTWKEAAKAATWFERMITSWELWLVIGLVVGGGVTKLYLDNKTIVLATP